MIAAHPNGKAPMLPSLLHRAVAALCALALGLGSPGPATAQPAANNLPSLGDPASEDFGVGAERRLGEQVMREIRRDPDYLDDPLLLEYLEGLWQPLVARARALGHIGPDLDERFAWEVFLVRDRSVNAFALPGGYVGVHLGLIGMTASRDELASVLAHELSHVTQRHIARNFANSKRQSLISAAGLILGILAASRAGNADVANAAIVGSQAAAIQGQLNFSRDMEREADRIGYSVLTGAGYSPGGMAAMFEKLDQAARLNDSGAFPYLRSHPLTSERIGEARARLGTADGARVAPTLEHALAQARARVLMDPRTDALRRWQATDAELAAGAPLADRLAAVAQSALASTLLRDWERADAALKRADELLRGNGRQGTEPRAERGTPEPRAERAVALLRVQSLLARGDAARAATVLQPWAGDGSRPAALWAAQVALAAQPAVAPADAALKRAADELQARLAGRALDAGAWATLGQVWARLGQPLRALRAEAESRYAVGDLPGAAERLRAGQRLARSGAPADFIEASVIDARLRDIETQRKQELTLDRQAP